MTVDWEFGRLWFLVSYASPKLEAHLKSTRCKEVV